MRDVIRACVTSNSEIPAHTNSLNNILSIYGCDPGYFLKGKDPSMKHKALFFAFFIFFMLYLTRKYLGTYHDNEGLIAGCLKVRKRCFVYRADLVEIAFMETYISTMFAAA